MNSTIYLEFENEACRVVVDRINHPIHKMVHASFENGYENIFFTDVTTGEWIEQDLGKTELAGSMGELVGNDEESDFPKQEIIWYRDNSGDRPFQFGYIKYRNSGFTFYEIFGTNHRYMFTLFKNKQTWKVFSHTKQLAWNFDTDYFQDVPFVLDTYQL